MAAFPRDEHLTNGWKSDRAVSNLMASSHGCDDGVEAGGEDVWLPTPRDGDAGENRQQQGEHQPRVIANAVADMRSRAETFVPCGTLTFGGAQPLAEITHGWAPSSSVRQPRAPPNGVATRKGHTPRTLQRGASVLARRQPTTERMEWVINDHLVRHTQLRGGGPNRFTANPNRGRGVRLEIQNPRGRLPSGLPQSPRQPRVARLW